MRLHLDILHDMKRTILFFLALITATVTICQTYFDMPSGTTYACEGIFRDPGGANDYVDFTDTVSTFCSVNPNDRMVVFFTDMDIEQGYDNLYVFDGPDVNSPLLATYTGNIFGQRLCASGNCLTFQFVSDYSVQGSGWAAELECVPECDMVDTSYNMPPNRVATCYGTFKDSGGDANYQDYEDTTSVFCPTNTNSLMRIDFSFVDIESGYDYLYIHDGPTTAFPILDSLDGYFTNLSYTSTQGCLTFHFVSDYSVTNQGWQGTLSCVEDSTTLGVEESIGTTGIYTYPNPTSGLLFLSTDLGVEVQDLYLVDVRGRILTRREVHATTSPLFLEDFDAGMYLLSFSANGIRYSERVIIEH